MYFQKRFFFYFCSCLRVRLYTPCVYRGQKAPNPLKLELQGVVRHPVDAGNQICGLCKNSKCSLLMSHLSIFLQCTFYVLFDHFVDFYKSNDNVLHLSRELYVTYRGIICFPIQWVSILLYVKVMPQFLPNNLAIVFNIFYLECGV